MKTTSDLKYEEIACAICGSSSYEIVYPRIKQKEDVALSKKYSASQGIMSTDQIVKCSTCNLVYVNPRPASGMIIDACAEGEDEVYVSQPEGRIAAFQKGLDYISKYRKIGKILDVGCAAGFFLKTARERGWEVYGVEPNTWLCEYGNKEYGLSNKPCTLEDADFKKEHFDVVTLWDVLEHVPDPSSTLEEVHRVLKKEGLVVISYPNFDSIYSKVLKRKWWFLLSHHLYYFTPDTISRLLKKKGFKVLEQKRHTQQLQIGYMVTMLANLNKDNILGKLASIGEKTLKLLRLYDLKIWYYAGQTDVIAIKQ